MAYKFALVIATLVGQVLSFGIILDPPYRNVVGSATEKACGSGLSTYLAQHPGADTANVLAAAGSGYNSAACAVDVCGGYQFADSPASRIITFTTSQQMNFTVNYTVPTKPPAGDYYDIYVPILTLTYTSTGIAVWEQYDFATQAGSPQLLSHPSMDYMNQILSEYQDPVIPTGACGAAGECFMSWTLTNYYHGYSSDGGRILDAGCVDVIIDWSTSTSK